MTHVHTAPTLLLAFCSAVLGECPSDLNGDGDVNGTDLGVMLSQWASGGTADLNDDGTVGGADLGLLMASWGECSPGCDDTEPFTYVVIPDTQFMTVYHNQSLPEMFYRQCDWMVENAEALNIRFVSHLGDIVEFGADDNQWAIANNAMSRLDGHLPYGLTFGNHDADDEIWGRSAIKFNETFPRSRYENEDWFGGGFPEGQYTNNFQTFNAGCQEYLVIHLQWDPPADVRAWADQVIGANSDKRVIVSTHEFPGNYVLWDEVLRHHANVGLVVSGHECARERFLPLVNDYGVDVPTILTDYQCDNPAQALLRYYTFDPTSDAVSAWTYSPWTDSYETDWNSQFTFTTAFGTQPACESESSEPFTGVPIALPGRIQGEDYDAGCNNFAFYDIDQANQGGEYRNDPVDLAVAEDVGQGYYLGWLRDGEWIQYTVSIAKAGTYLMQLRVASEGDGSSMRLQLDGVDLGPAIDIAPTGGWQVWETLDLPAVSLPEGEHVLKVVVDDGDFNINFIDVFEAQP